MQLRSVGVYRFRAALCHIFLMSMAVVAAGCSNSKPTLDTRAGLGCVNDSPHCVRQRIATLDSFLADTSHSWVMQPASPRAYASGVRMFAFRKKRSALSCPQLKHGRGEAARAPAALRSRGAGLSPAQISRGLMLANDVGRDLKREIKRRC